MTPATRIKTENQPHHAAITSDVMANNTNPATMSAMTFDQDGSAPFVPPATLPMPEPDVINPSGTPDEPEPLIAASSIATALNFLRHAGTSAARPETICALARCWLSDMAK